MLTILLCLINALDHFTCMSACARVHTHTHTSILFSQDTVRLGHMTKRRLPSKQAPQKQVWVWFERTTWKSATQYSNHCANRGSARYIYIYIYIYIKHLFSSCLHSMFYNQSILNENFSLPRVKKSPHIVRRWGSPHSNIFTFPYHITRLLNKYSSYYLTRPRL